MNGGCAGRSVEANVSAANVKRGLGPRGRSQKSPRTRQAVRGVKDMFRKDGLLGG
jgi:hypothetical protein